MLSPATLELGEACQHEGDLPSSSRQRSTRSCSCYTLLNEREEPLPLFFVRLAPHSFVANLLLSTAVAFSLNRLVEKRALIYPTYYPTSEVLGVRNRTHGKLSGHGGSSVIIYLKYLTGEDRKSPPSLIMPHLSQDPKQPINLCLGYPGTLLDEKGRKMGKEFSPKEKNEYLNI